MGKGNYDHVYAIIRVELDSEAIGPNIVTVKRVVWSKEVADGEVERLNALNADKGCLYFSQLTRLDPAIEEKADGSSLCTSS